MPSIEVPQGYPYVLATVVSTYWLNLWQIRGVGAARGKAHIQYPQLYAEKAEAAASLDAMKFNCAQRAHQNTLETLPHTVFGILFTGLKFPILASALGAGFVLGRVIYTINYSSGTPGKRNTKGGFLGLATSLGLLLASTYTAYTFVVEAL